MARRRPQTRMLCDSLVLDETVRLSLSELCQLSGVHLEELIQMIEEGLLEPHGEALSEWRFPLSAICRIHTALRLQRDFQLNLDGVALVLGLLDELRELRARIKTLEFQLPQNKYNISLAGIEEEAGPS